VNHAPLPWKTSEDVMGIVAPCGEVDEKDIWSSDAKFIVRAVNSHDALVEALENLLAWTEHICSNRGFDSPEVVEARAALAKARGEGVKP
jgi:hypothetical protein